MLSFQLLEPIRPPTYAVMISPFKNVLKAPPSRRPIGHVETITDDLDSITEHCRLGSKAIPIAF
jgi:hypothetical protein